MTLLELLIAMSVVSVLSGSAILGVGHLRETATIQTLDTSLQTFRTNALAIQILQDLSDADSATAALDDTDSHGDVDFSLQEENEHLVIQATRSGSTDPCRKMTFGGQGPIDCDDSFTSDTAIIHGDSESAAKAPETTSTTTTSTTSTTTTTTVPPTPTTIPPQAAPPFHTTVSPRQSTMQWWDNHGSKGAWVARFTYQNDWIRHQYLDIEVTLHHSNGTTTTQQVKGFYVAGNGRSTQEIYDNTIAGTSGNYTGINSVSTRIVAVKTSTENWQSIQGSPTPAVTTTYVP